MIAGKINGMYACQGNVASVRPQFLFAFCIFEKKKKTIWEKKRRNVESRDDLCAEGRSRYAGAMPNLAWRLSQVLLQPCTQAETKDAFEPLRAMRRRMMMDGRGAG